MTSTPESNEKPRNNPAIPSTSLSIKSSSSNKKIGKRDETRIMGSFFLENCIKITTKRHQ
jgi:hypothetical protein